MQGRMVVTRSPLRITFVGGGTDLPFYYENRDYGAVVSSTINKYIYVAVNQKFDGDIKVSYSKTEIVNSVDEIKHPSVREALRLMGIDGAIEIASLSDIPSKGTGLGSSSTFLVGLLQALHYYKGETVTAQVLAMEAVHIEREVLREEGGKQDQYAAAYGGINLMRFRRDGRVEVKRATCTDGNLKKIGDSLLLLYTNKQRRSKDIQKYQFAHSSENMEIYDKMKELVEPAFDALCEGNVDLLGKYMHENWQLKRTLSRKISDEWIDEKYKKALSLGAKGGKLVGAGGGGFLLIVADPDKHDTIVKELGLRKIDFNLNGAGSTVVFCGD